MSTEDQPSQEAKNHTQATDVPSVKADISESATPSLQNQSFVFPYRKFSIISMVALLLLLVLWVVYALFFTNITVATTSVNANASDSTLKNIVKKQVSTYKLTLEYPDRKKQQFTLKNLGVTVDQPATLKAIQDHQKFIKRLQWWQNTAVNPVTKIDTATFATFTAKNTTVIAQPPQDATLSLKDGKISIVDATSGKRYGLPNPKQQILASVKKLEPQTLKLQTLKVTPAISSENLQPYKASLEKTLSQPVVFTLGSKVTAATPTDIASWLEITPHADTKKVDITVNSGKVQEYINKITRNEIRPPRAQVIINQPDGTQRVLVAGVNGIDVTNKSTAAASVARTLLSNSGIKTDLVVRNEAYKSISSSLYDKWIEVDITHKRMYAYEKDVLINTQLISAGAPGTPTVTGQYAIYTKFPQQDMRGRNVDGSNYFQPHVRWVSYFYKDYAIHGNYWRPVSYFGNINSSHGCVGVVDNDASWIYNWAPVGTPVIVHE